MGVVGSADNAHQFAVIKPVEKAVGTVVDDDVARTVVEMSIHAPVTVGAINVALQIMGIRSGSDQSPLLVSAEFFNQRQEDGHGNEHAAAACAVADSDLGQGRVHE